jgi:hypothetical protein
MEQAYSAFPKHTVTGITYLDWSAEQATHFQYMGSATFDTPLTDTASEANSGGV